MKTSHLILSAAWIITIVVAFSIGSKLGSDDSPEAQDHSTAGQSENKRSTQRAASRERATETSQRNGGSGDRAGVNATSTSAQITAIMANDNPMARAEALIGFINSLGANDFEQAVADFRELGITRERMSEYSMLLHAWAKTDPLAALDYAEKNTGSPFARQTILASWAADSPEAALDWAKKHHEGDGANPWLVGVIRGIVAVNPSQATEIMKTLPYSRERGDALSAIIPHIAKMGADKASEWLNAIEDNNLRQGGAAYLAAFMAKKDPAATAAWVMSLKDEDAVARAAGTVAGTWAEADLNAAISWTDSLQEKAKMSAARQLIAHYASEDPAKASAWMSGMAGQPGYQEVLGSYISHTARNNPEMSLSHVAEITNEQSKLRYYGWIYGRWQERDPNAAQTWMQNSQLSEEAKQRMLSSRREGDRRRNN